MSELRRLTQTNHKFETSLGYTEKRLQKTNQAKQTSESLDESSGAQQRSHRHLMPPGRGCAAFLSTLVCRPATWHLH